MRILKIILITLILGGLTVPLAGCASKSNPAPSSETQVVTVQRGNLVVDITAVGNLKLSRTADLAFDISGTVEETLVKEGDMVKEGQVLARLDISAWEDQVTALESQLTAAERQLTTAKRQLTAKQRAVTTAERQLTTKQRAVTTAERQLEAKRSDVTAKERSLLQAEINLKNAEIALEKAQDTYKWPAIEVAEADVTRARTYLQYALDSRAEASGNMGAIWDRAVARAQAELNAAETTLKALLTGADPNEVAIKKMQLEVAQGQLADAKKAIDTAQIAVEDAQVAVADARIAVADAQIAVEDTQVSVEDARIAVADAEKDVERAQKALDEALKTSPEITAPFDGFVTKVNVSGGDEVKKGTVAVQVADPNKFEADILVSEMDIMQVKAGAEAWVQVDAMRGISFPAKVTHIAPTATIQQSVVNYKVKVEIQSREAVTPRQQAMPGVSSGELPERLRQQAPETQRGQVPAMKPEGFQLREGLTVTVGILLEERKDVLLVPNAAVAREGRETYVQILKDGVTGKRLITTGLSNWQYTEVISGLAEGEKVAVPKTTTAPTTPQPGQGSPGGIIPGMGRMLR